MPSYNIKSVNGLSQNADYNKYSNTNGENLDQSKQII